MTRLNWNNNGAVRITNYLITNGIWRKLLYLYDFISMAPSHLNRDTWKHLGFSATDTKTTDKKKKNHI